MGTQSKVIDDNKLQRKIRMNALLLGFVAFGFFIAFVVATALKV
jgi:hypothetical protein